MHLHDLERNGIFKTDKLWNEYRKVMICNLVRFDGRLGDSRNMGIRLVDVSDESIYFNVLCIKESLVFCFRLDRTRDFCNVKLFKCVRMSGCTLKRKRD